ncbi:hypothetical protein BHM03_00032194 [Ensete ventricosum]|nr:hypothetical protein BHM03_00032194 [Ensete ventricosum]
MIDFIPSAGGITPINFNPHAAPDAYKEKKSEPSKPYSGSREAWDSIEGGGDYRRSRRPRQPRSIRRRLTWPAGFSKPYNLEPLISWEATEEDRVKSCLRFLLVEEKTKPKVEDGIFGTLREGVWVTKQNQLFVGRVAMLGFAVSVLRPLPSHSNLVLNSIIHKGALAQLNIETGVPNSDLEPLVLFNVAFFFFAALHPGMREAN